MTDNEVLTIHFHGGTKAVATITAEDLADESARVEQMIEKHKNNEWDADISCAEELVESALSIPPKPGWRWIGDAFVYTQAVAGIEYGSNV